MHTLLRLLSLPLLAFLLACGDTAKLPVEKGYGPEPELPPPTRRLIPTVDIAPAKGWPDGRLPVAAQGMRVTAFADGLEHPRWLLALPNGDVLVAETNSPKHAEGLSGIRGWVMTKVMTRAGAATPSANRITLLRDTTGDGVADVRSVFLDGLNSPFGMALVGDRLYVANTDAVLSFPYVEGQGRIDAEGSKVMDLPAGPRNHHWTKSLIASPDGKRLYVGVGSNSNVAEYGMEEEEGRAAIWEHDLETGRSRVYASGLRNPVGMAWEPAAQALWVAVNERDEIGSDLVPDYMTAVRENGFYGWPYSYYGGNVDERVEPRRPDLVAAAIKPDYALGNHTASLGLAWAEGSTLPEPFRSGMFVGQHGSWNRRPLSGYKVVFIRFEDGRPTGMPVDVLTGFLSEKEEAYGRPVGVVMDTSGALLVADDVGNAVWRVSAPER